jgi:hypothetical protein
MNVIMLLCAWKGFLFRRPPLFLSRLFPLSNLVFDGGIMIAFRPPSFGH